MIDDTHDPARTSWVPGADGHPDFPVQNLPLGVFSPAGAVPRIGTAIGGHILDLSGVASLLPPGVAGALSHPTLNALFALPPSERLGLRRRLSALLSDPAHRPLVEPMLHAAGDCTMHLPCAVRDYTDFYAGIHHAENVGRLFRPDAPLLPNYKHVPIGYHGRASSVRVGGVPVVRPNGQRRGDADAPTFGPTERLDYELELGVWLAGGTALGRPIPIGRAHEHVAGLCLLNDWSARDVQAWEYQPLGPFLAKSFHTSVSPWVVTVEALAPFRVAQPARPAGDPRPLPYLWNDADQETGAFAIELAVLLSTPAMRAAGDAPQRLSVGPATSLYWTVAQLVAHHASNGCDLGAGDLLGTGTISSTRDEGRGSLLEITDGGRTALTLHTGEERTFLQDGDEVILSARSRADGFAPIGFGDCRATVRPSPVFAA
ncbi:MAG: fumarylacetoacetase [Janthinobacterium lividum]